MNLIVNYIYELIVIPWIKALHKDIMDGVCTTACVIS